MVLRFGHKSFTNIRHIIKMREHKRHYVHDITGSPFDGLWYNIICHTIAIVPISCEIYFLFSNFIVSKFLRIMHILFLNQVKSRWWNCNKIHSSYNPKFLVETG